MDDRQIAQRIRDLRAVEDGEAILRFAQWATIAPRMLSLIWPGAQTSEISSIASRAASTICQIGVADPTRAT